MGDFAVVAMLDVISLFQDHADEYSPEANEYLIWFVDGGLFCSCGS